MAKYLVINNDVIENIIVAESKEIAEQITGFNCIEYTEGNPEGIGWEWNGTEFTNPFIPTP
jgi:hypothetical protein